MQFSVSDMHTVKIIGETEKKKDFETELYNYWFEDVLRLLRGGVGAMGLRGGGVVPLDLTEPEGVDVLLAPVEGRRRMEE